MTRNEGIGWMLAVAGFGAMAFLPLLEDADYLMGLALNITMFTVLATSWALFSGPTHYISLATAAFYGVGATVVAMGFEVLPFPVLLGLAGLAGGVLAALVGLATLRLSGVYFVIFTLGLAELIRQLVSWVQSNIVEVGSIQVFTDNSDNWIYWELLALAALVFLVGWLIERSRLGFAMRIIGNDEVVASHSGIHSAGSKVILFVISGFFAAAVGAVMVTRIINFDPDTFYLPIISFQVVIMALLGGVHRLWGPLLGVIPFTLLWEVIENRFQQPMEMFGVEIVSAGSLKVILLGVCFMLIVYYIPRGVGGRVETLARRLAPGGGASHG